MVNSLDIATINQFGIDHDSPLEARRKAGIQFSRALSRGVWLTIWRKVRGQDNRLRALGEAQQNAERRPAHYRGVVNVPLNKIVGSEGRTGDFDSAFNPLKTHNRDRWIGIAAARRNGIPLPPVELVQAGDEYYVRDGNHRVSVAKAAGQAEIEAQIEYVLA